MTGFAPRAANERISPLFHPPGHPVAFGHRLTIAYARTHHTQDAPCRASRYQEDSYAE
jgi:hypothetical protein